ncbi:MAG TPA: metalloregulator ArsR/SmtB family transcription factor [Halanaerobiales bacterium]|nr:metalloregulator ArsR/SmtB family transcription factor [Halanaerobiales bacterium]
MENIIKDMDEIKEKAKILKAISHPIRLCVVKGLMESEGYNVTKMQSCLDIPQSTLSQHLTKLKDLNIIEGERNGVEIKYYVKNDEVKKIINTIFEEK